MASLDSLGYNTYVLSTIRAVTECEKIIVYDRNVFAGTPGYSRINLYNLLDIYYGVLYDRDVGTNGQFNSHCLQLSRTIENPEESQEVPFEYDCSNSVTNGFNMIIYLDSRNNPTGYTEFINIQGRVSDYIRIYLKFSIEINQIVLEFSNSLWKIKSRLSKDFIGPELNKFPSSSTVESEIKKLPKDQLYTSHLSNFLRAHNTSGVILGDRVLSGFGEIKKLNLLRNTNIFGGDSYSNYQIGYYGDDIVLYSWTYLEDDIGYYYKITSLLNGNNYKYTRQSETGEIIDLIGPYDSDREKSKELLYCAGKYLVFKISFGSSINFIALYDTSVDSWVKYSNPNNVLVDCLDREMRIYELPKSTSIQSFDTALELIPSISDTFSDLNEYIQTSHSLDIIQKIGDWFIIRNPENGLYLFTCLSMSVWMTYDEYKNCIVINNNTILLKDSEYYIIYHGPQRKTYYTEKAKCILENLTLYDFRLRGRAIKVCSDEYLEAYKKSEIAIVYKDSMIYDGFLDSYRRQSIERSYKVPPNIIGSIGSIIFYLDQYNNINYI